MVGEPLVGDYTVREVAWETLRPVFNQLHGQIFGRTLTYDVETALSDAERDGVRRLQQRLGRLLRLNYLIYHGQEAVGWHTGMQVGSHKYYMMNTGVLPAHQGRGIYTALLPRVLARAQAEGFQIVYSRHTATNNRIIVPKLKAGFVITGFELDDVFGLLVHLSYFYNPLRRQALDFRSGQALPDEELRRLLQLG